MNQQKRFIYRFSHSTFPVETADRSEDRYRAFLKPHSSLHVVTHLWWKGILTREKCPGALICKTNIRLRPSLFGELSSADARWSRLRTEVSVNSCQPIIANKALYLQATLALQDVIKKARTFQLENASTIERMSQRIRVAQVY